MSDKKRSYSGLQDDLRAANAEVRQVMDANARLKKEAQDSVQEARRHACAAMAETYKLVAFMADQIHQLYAQKAKL